MFHSVLKKLLLQLLKLLRKNLIKVLLIVLQAYFKGKQQVYKSITEGGNPNASSVIRLRGISTVGSNAQPLIVIDGIIGASLDNIDPADIESMNVLKDGSAASIYGSRGSAGVILVTTKKGKEGPVKFECNGQLAFGVVGETIPVLTAAEFRAGSGAYNGFDAGNTSNWLDEVTRNSVTNIHNFSASGGSGKQITELLRM